MKPRASYTGRISIGALTTFEFRAYSALRNTADEPMTWAYSEHDGQRVSRRLVREDGEVVAVKDTQRVWNAGSGKEPLHVHFSQDEADIGKQEATKDIEVRDFARESLQDIASRIMAVQWIAPKKGSETQYATVRAALESAGVQGQWEGCVRTRGRPKLYRLVSMLGQMALVRISHCEHVQRVEPEAQPEPDAFGVKTLAGMMEMEAGLAAEPLDMPYRYLRASAREKTLEVLNGAPVEEVTHA